MTTDVAIYLPKMSVIRRPITLTELARMLGEDNYDANAERRSAAIKSEEAEEQISDRRRHLERIKSAMLSIGYDDVHIEEDAVCVCVDNNVLLHANDAKLLFAENTITVLDDWNFEIC